jgi:hypothetical protein
VNRWQDLPLTTRVPYKWLRPQVAAGLTQLAFEVGHPAYRRGRQTLQITAVAGRLPRRQIPAIDAILFRHVYCHVATTSLPNSHTHQLDLIKRANQR